MQMEDGAYADNRRNSRTEDKLWVGALAEMQTTLSWYKNVVGAVYEKHLQILLRKEQSDRNEDLKWWKTIYINASMTFWEVTSQKRQNYIPSKVQNKIVHLYATGATGLSTRKAILENDRKEIGRRGTVRLPFH
jgi:hypothetical protein